MINDDLKTLQTKYDRLKEQADAFAITSGVIGRAKEYGVKRRHAMPDFERRAKADFSVDEAGNLVCHLQDGNGQPLSVDGWFSQCRATAAHLFELASGAGLIRMRERATDRLLRPYGT